jgi:hypothetical protein
MECETQLIDRISAENCVELLFFTEENHPAFYLKKYAFAFLRKFSSEVMATEAWEKAEQEHPKLCMTMLKTLSRLFRYVRRSLINICTRLKRNLIHLLQRFAILKLTCYANTFNCIIVPFMQKYNQDVENLKSV